MVDDLLVYRLSGGKGFLLVVNASNISKDFSWACSRAEGYDVLVEDLSEDWAEVALQGPEAENVMLQVMGLDVKDLVFYTFTELKWNGYPLIVSRTGYTGEDGFEIYGSPEAVCHVWKTLLDAGVQPCGLGCRDTLRFEAGLPLYGHELSDSISPVEAGYRAEGQGYTACRVSGSRRRRACRYSHHRVQVHLHRQEPVHGHHPCRICRSRNGTRGGDPPQAFPRYCMQEEVLPDKLQEMTAVRSTALPG